MKAGVFAKTQIVVNYSCPFRYAQQVKIYPSAFVLPAGCLQDDSWGWVSHGPWQGAAKSLMEPEHADMLRHTLVVCFLILSFHWLCPSSFRVFHNYINDSPLLDKVVNFSHLHPSILIILAILEGLPTEYSHVILKYKIR